MRSAWPRQVIPKWRSSSTAAGLAESLPHRIVSTSEARKVPPEVVDELRRKIDLWEGNRDLGVATDLLSFGVIDELRGHLANPARFVLEHQNFITPQLQSLAEKVLSTEQYHEYFAQREYYQKAISRLKGLVRLNPKNPLAWVDLSRLYTVQGQKDRAKQAMKIALSLAPDNRFVLRSAARFLLHIDDADRALSVLKRSPRTTEDPWLLASMISVETVLERKPLWYKKATQILENQRFAPVHLAELGAAVATLHMNAGQARFAKRAFNVALQKPNDNAVAQAVWIANEYSLPMNILPEWLSDPYSAEANYYSLEKIGDYRSALSAACSWFEDEPISTRPLMAGAFAASILGKYQVAQDQMEQALTLDPNDIDCKNNLVFALAGQGILQDATKILLEVSNAEMSKTSSLSGHTLANWGMVLYRTGDFEKGNQLYEKAYAKLKASQENASADIALAFWAQEAKQAGDPRSIEVIESAQRHLNNDSFAAKIILARTVASTEEKRDISALKEKPGISTALLRSANSWTHDKDKNVLILDRALPFIVK